MGVYIAYISVFSYIQHYRRLFLYIYGNNPFFLPIYKTPSLFLCFAPDSLYRCFPYSKNNTFLSIHYFLNKVYIFLLPRLQYIYKAFLYIPIEGFPIQLYRTPSFLLFCPAFIFSIYIYILELMCISLYIRLLLFLYILPRLCVSLYIAFSLYILPIQDAFYLVFSLYRIETFLCLAQIYSYIQEKHSFLYRDISYIYIQYKAFSFVFCPDILQEILLFLFLFSPELYREIIHFAI